MPVARVGVPIYGEIGGFVGQSRGGKSARRGYCEAYAPRGQPDGSEAIMLLTRRKYLPWKSEDLLLTKTLGMPTALPGSTADHAYNLWPTGPRGIIYVAICYRISL